MPKYTREFEGWYRRNANRKTAVRDERLSRFLWSAAKTVALQGDPHETLVVNSIHQRFLNSTYRTLSKGDLWRVWCISNGKHKRYLNKIAKRNRTANSSVTVEYKRKRVLAGRK